MLPVQNEPLPPLAPGTLTFSKDIAPIVFERCAPCHRPGQAGPFSLLTYEDVRKRARQVAELTRRRYMPPWPPEPGYGEFVGARLLGREQIAKIGQWASEGAVEGERKDLPPAPRFSEGWQLGKPDLVLTMPLPYSLPAAGKEVFRNFVIPVSIPADRYVEAVELRPDNPSVHHAMLTLDATSSSRELDEKDPEPGFNGMIRGESDFPDGQLLVWVPGMVPMEPTDDLSFRLGAGTDLVLMLHLRATGKPETIRAAIGLFFTDRPPSRTPTILTLESQTIDIPAGSPEYTIEDRYALPVDAELLAVLPHAHFLGKEILGWATLPDGSRKWLIYIKDWDFNRQGAYRYARPVPLPKGTTLAVRVAYDNSAENPRNPSDPPRRVRYGSESSDEMGGIQFQVLARDEKEVPILQADHYRKQLQVRIAGLEKALEIDPNNARNHRLLALSYVDARRDGEALGHLERALELDPGLAEAHHTLGALLATKGRAAEAEAHYFEALRLDPSLAIAHYSLGDLYLGQERLNEAADSYRKATELNARLAAAHFGLGQVLWKQGKLDEAAGSYERAIAIKPDFDVAHYGLGLVRSRQGRLEQSAAQHREAIRLKPDFALAHCALGNVLAGEGRLAEAAESYERAIRINPDLGEAYQNLAKVRQILAQRR